MPGLLRLAARSAVVAGTATAVSNRVSRRQAGRWAQQDQQAYAEQQASAPAPAEAEPEPSPQDSRSEMLSQLSQLGELRQQGVLTEEEFQAEKAKILGS